MSQKSLEQHTPIPSYLPCPAELRIFRAPGSDSSSVVCTSDVLAIDIAITRQTPHPPTPTTKIATMSFASRVLSSSSHALATRTFSTSARRMADSPLPARKPLGAFRGGLFGFLLGSFLSGSAAYSYLLKEYKTANDLLTEDIYTLQASVTRLSNYVQALETRTQGKK
ncbi:lipoprotein leucine-zipper domain-containing protein [Fusarium austroafricanum]|uniref:Lipoprotein leucine-zipper domain-containing protein n=1 Tax=Fusarium austroafricanum TaxID=2364996 RepID=A0A8H4KLD2_9HYPO|nr:lipoprotein leucine-zipper domain-containing protein [Fusarium austroafricanum]